MRLLVLGGTRFVGRAVIDEALSRGWDVTAVNRRSAPPRVPTLQADRTRPGALAAAVADATWDLAVDTWSGAPAVATQGAEALVGRVGRYAYVSSVSVYRWGEHVDESSPLVDGDPGAADGEYAAIKRGAELGVQRSFPDALLARAGLVLGPHEDIGRLPWWLDRISRGGQVVAPGRPDRPLQYIDARDLAAWILTASAGGIGAAVDVISASGHASTQSLLQACVDATGSAAELVWIDEDTLAAAGAQPWTQLPCWVPEHGDTAGFLEADTSRAAAAGLRCRPVADTVGDTWRWLQEDGYPSQRADRPAHGLPAELEARLLGAR